MSCRRSACSWVGLVLLLGCTRINAVSTQPDTAIVPGFNDAGADGPNGDRLVDAAADDNNTGPTGIVDAIAPQLDVAPGDTDSDSGAVAPESAEHLSLEALRTTSLDVADADGDGQMDVVFGYEGSRGYLASTTGRRNAICFDVARSGFDRCRDIPETSGFGWPSQTSNVLIRDVDRDGNQDVVAFNRFAAVVHTGERALNGSLTFSMGTEFYFDFGQCKGAHGTVADLNGDARLDLVFYELWLGTPTTCAVSSGGSVTGDGSYRLQLSEPTGPVPGRDFAGAVELPIIGVGQLQDLSQDLLVADVDGDEQLDIVVAGPTAHGIQWFRNIGSGAFAAPEKLPIAVETWLTQFGLSDVDGDGNIDVLLVYIGATHPAAVYFGAGDGTFSAPLLLPLRDTDAGLVVGISAGDLDGDGRKDLVLARRYDDATHDPRYYERIVVRLADADRSFAAPHTVTETEGDSRGNLLSAVIRVVKLDGNDRADLVLGLRDRVDRILLNPNVGP